MVVYLLVCLFACLIGSYHARFFGSSVVRLLFDCLYVWLISRLVGSLIVWSFDMLVFVCLFGRMHIRFFGVFVYRCK